MNKIDEEITDNVTSMNRKTSDVMSSSKGKTGSNGAPTPTIRNPLSINLDGPGKSVGLLSPTYSKFMMTLRSGGMTGKPLGTSQLGAQDDETDGMSTRRRRRKFILLKQPQG